MIEAISRVVMYVAWAVYCLLSALVAFSLGALLGCGAGAILLACVQSVNSQVEASAWTSLFQNGGAMMGGGWALIGAARHWITEALKSHDPFILGSGQYFDELSRAVKRPR